MSRIDSQFTKSGLSATMVERTKKMQRIVIISLIAIITCITAYRFFFTSEENKTPLKSEKTPIVEVEKETFFIALTYTLPQGSLTNHIVASGCTGSEITWQSDFICKSEWTTFDQKHSEAQNLKELSIKVPVQHGQGVKFNFSANNLIHAWLCRGDLTSFGTLKAITSTGKKLNVFLVKSGPDGCNFWVHDLYTLDDREILHDGVAIPGPVGKPGNKR